MRSLSDFAETTAAAHSKPVQRPSVRVFERTGVSEGCSE